MPDPNFTMPEREPKPIPQLIDDLERAIRAEPQPPITGGLINKTCPHCGRPV